MTGIIAIIVFFALIVIGVPLFVGVGLASVYYFLVSGFPLEIIVQNVESTASSFPLLAVPFFVFAGHIMMDGGAGRRIVKLSSVLMGKLPGGLAVVTVGAAMIFAGMSGSLIADTAAVGSVMIPGMVKKNYHKNFASAIVCSSGSIGVIIPPSIPMILFGFMAGTSVGDLFLAGIVPGILVGVSMMIVSVIVAKVRKYETEEKKGNVKQALLEIVDALPSLGVIVVILGGIFAGIFTATEAAAVAVVYALVIGFLVHKELKIKDLPKILINSTITSATILLVIGAVGALTWGLTANQVPQRLTTAILSITQNRYIILLLINAILLLFGCVMGLAPALLLTTPLLLPVATSIGLHPLHFGLIVVANLAVGSFTPPVGGALYVSSQIAGISITETVKGLVPLYIANIIVLLIITYIPELTLLIPRLVGAL